MKKQPASPGRSTIAMPAEVSLRIRSSLFLYSYNPPISEIAGESISLEAHAEFDGVGFGEDWGIDFSDMYYSAGHPFRRADMFCFKPHQAFGFHRIGSHGRKPWGEPRVR
jgi:hypothetical protein